MVDIMLDLETLGTTPGCVILSIGACVVGKPDVNFYTAIRVSSSLDNGLKIEADTLSWWMHQSSEARFAAFPDNAECVPAALMQFEKWCSNALSNSTSTFINIWGNGSDFDNAILSAAYKKAGMQIPWDFRNNRCYRTLAAQFPQIKKPAHDGAKHHALHDAIAQAAHLDLILKHIEKLNLIMKYTEKRTDQCTDC